ncbi:sugar transferase [Paenibacillus sp. CAU 1782]
MLKRFLDATGAALLLLLLLPLMGAVGLLVKLKLGSPVLFRQQRPGLHGKPFYLYKFRSLTDERDESGALLPDGLRMTPFGRLLRRSSMDELPQLWNVLKGELSFVGPRPLLMDYLPLYSKEQARRHLVRPGITGWAQVNGRNDVTWEERFQRDLWYVENVSLLLDLKIVGLTVKKVWSGDGTSHSGHVSMPLFEGTASRQEG